MRKRCRIGRQLSGFVAGLPGFPAYVFVTSGLNGELARGLKMLAEDIHAGRGHLRIRQVDARPFKLGVNMAATPGKVIYRNELMELIQYEPTTPKVYKRPLLYVPAWINKYYILDLNPEKSFVRWAVAQGLTVFAISWVNPDERHADKGLDAYMHEGILAALTAIEDATGEIDVTAIGYCVGGTLLSVTLAYMAAVDDRRVSSATLFASLVDFTDVGDLKVFIDAEQLKAVEERMAEQGYLEGSHMAAAFNMLRPNDLIWSYYVNNYLKGKEPMPFDLLVWNSNSTRMPAANHNFYLRHCYLQNDLSNGRMVLSGKTLDLGRVTIPMYVLSSREDHIAPARGVFKGAQCFGGPVRFVTAGFRPYRRRRQPGRQAEISVLDRRAARGRFQVLDRRRQGDAGVLVARLGQVGHRPSAGEGSRPQAGRGQAEGDLRRAGRVCAGEGVTRAPRGGGRVNGPEKRSMARCNSGTIMRPGPGF